MTFLLPPAPSPYFSGGNYPPQWQNNLALNFSSHERATLYREQVQRNIETRVVNMVKQIVRGDKPFFVQNRIEASPTLVASGSQYNPAADFTLTESFVANGGWSWRTKADKQILPRLPHGLMYVKFGTKISQRKFALQFHLMSKIHGMVIKSMNCTIRDLYYENVSLYESQNRLESAIYDLCHILKVPRDALRLEATSKGLMAGNLKFQTTTGDVINLAHFKSGMLIPSVSGVDDMCEIQSDAKQIIVVEKDAVFQRLIDERVFEEIGPTILITGKGYPDLVTLKMIRKLRDALNLTVFAFVDCDPYGVEIASVIRWGSFKQASIAKCANDWSIAEELTVPNLVWLGLLPSEISDFSLTHRVSSKMTMRDRHKTHLVKADPVWIHEIDVLQCSEYKAELEALFIHPRFANFYLQQKLNAYYKLVQPSCSFQAPAPTPTPVSSTNTSGSCSNNN
ncbi:Meiotic recombination protein SPO11 [Folsomia candida]|uniref:DNA topoisomerase (ATP-hydrolyzing) n=1 Tax=Folsomia candida TaxID=158441 RepID=A0A226DLK5_FOLCA|nr:Meiotic recombination protein SPO11 [Folsomia candida]